MEAFGESVVAVLVAGGFDVAIAGEFFRHGDKRLAGGIENIVEARGEEAGFEACGAEHGLLRQGDAFDGEEFLRVDGFIDGDEVGFEVVDLVEIFQADDGELGGGETVLAGPEGAVGIFGRTRAGGLGRAGAIGGEWFGGDGLARHAIDSGERYSTPGEAGFRDGRSSGRKDGKCLRRAWSERRGRRQVWWLVIAGTEIADG